MASSSADGPRPLIRGFLFILSALSYCWCCASAFCKWSADFSKSIPPSLTERSQFISSVRDRQLALVRQVSKGTNSLAAPLRPVSPDGAEAAARDQSCFCCLVPTCTNGAT